MSPEILGKTNRARLNSSSSRRQSWVIRNFDDAEADDARLDEVELSAPIHLAFDSLRLVIWPSVWLFDHGGAIAALTANLSLARPLAKDAERRQAQNGVNALLERSAVTWNRLCERSEANQRSRSRQQIASRSVGASIGGRLNRRTPRSLDRRASLAMTTGVRLNLTTACPRHSRRRCRRSRPRRNIEGPNSDRTGRPCYVLAP